MKTIFTFDFKGDSVTVVELPSGTYEVNYYQGDSPVVTLHKYSLEMAMELARAFIDDDGVEQ